MTEYVLVQSRTLRDQNNNFLTDLVNYILLPEISRHLTHIIEAAGLCT